MCIIQKFIFDFLQRINLASGALRNSALATAVFIKTIDELFDIFNGSKNYPENGKLLKTAISENSPHFRTWDRIEKFVGM